MPDRTKRAYLPRGERRKSMLIAASEIVESEGWSRLSMSYLAEYSGISRQLVYQHFDNLEELMVATSAVIFEQVFVETERAVSAFDGDITETLTQTQRATLDLPPGRVRALWQLLAGTFPADHELTQVSLRLRRLLVGLWQPAAMKAFHLDAERAAVVSWMLLMSFWGGYHLMASGDATKEQAIEGLDWLVNHLAEGAGTTETPGT